MNPLLINEIRKGGVTYDKRRQYIRTYNSLTYFLCHRMNFIYLFVVNDDRKNREPHPHPFYRVSLQVVSNLKYFSWNNSFVTLFLSVLTFLV